MNWYAMGWAWTTGSFTTSGDVDLDPNQSYLVTGGVTESDGGGKAHLYISVLCTSDGDQQLCGIRDEGGDDGLTLVEALPPRSSRVTISFRSTGGGTHRGEYVIYQL